MGGRLALRLEQDDAVKDDDDDDCITLTVIEWGREVWEEHVSNGWTTCIETGTCLLYTSRCV